MDPPIHEFWLHRHSDWAVKEFRIMDEENKSEIYRVALGELVDASSRTTFRVPEGSKSMDLWNKTGSIGFMDLTVREERVPKRGAATYSGRDHIYLPQDMEPVKALVMMVVGIEPQYRGRGYLRVFTQRMIEIIKEWGLDTLVADAIENPRMRELCAKAGTVYDDGYRAVIRL